MTGSVLAARPTASRNGPLRTVLSNPALRRIESAWSIGIAGDAMFTVAILVAAFQIGGPAAVGILSLVRMAPSIVAAPFAGLVAGRRQPTDLLLVTQGVRGVGAAVVTVGLVLGWPAVIGLLGAAVVATAGAFIRPFQVAATPSYARTPDELVATNSVTSTGEGVGAFGGPIVGAFVIALSGPIAAAALAAAFFGIATACLLRLEASADERAARAMSDVGQVIADGPLSMGTVAQELVGGIRVAWRRPAAGVVLAGFASQVFVRGLMMPLLVVTAIELVGLGEPGVGTLVGAHGLGTLVGAVLSVRLAVRRTLASTFALSLALWGLPLALIAAVPTPAVAIAALLLSGIANAILDVAGFTLLQRCVRDAERISVFALLESSAGFGVGVGGAVAPLLIDVLGDRGALAAAGVILPIVAVASWSRLRRVDRAMIVPDVELRLLRANPLFDRLPLTALERLAEGMRPVELAAGEVLMRQGEPGDSYAIVARGTFEVAQDGRVIATVVPGEGVGEIALLRSGTRSATVVATTPAVVYRIESAVFLAAVAGPTSTALAASMIDERLGRSARA